VLFHAVLRIVTWLLVLGVFAGLGGRLLMVPGAQAAPCAEVEHCCDADDDHHAPVQEQQDEHEDDHGPNCPPGPHHHHHQGHCCSGGAMTAEVGSHCRLAVLEEGRTTLCLGADKPPEAPVYSLDKPPLI
jgi:hypothetical protein